MSEFCILLFDSHQGIPTYILPTKTNHYASSYESLPVASAASSTQEQRYISRYIPDPQVSNNLSSSTCKKRSGGVFWSQSLSRRSQSEPEGDTSSGEDEGSRSSAERSLEPNASFLHRPRLHSDLRPSPRPSKGESPARDDPSPTPKSSAFELPQPATATEESSGVVPKPLERFDPPESAPLIENHTRSSGSASSSSDGHHSSTASSSQHCLNSSASDLGLGVLELSLLFDDSQQALHCSVHRAKVPAFSAFTWLCLPHISTKQ